MTRHDEREAVRGTEGSGRARSSGPAGEGGELAVRDDLAARDRTQLPPRVALERRRPAQVDGHVLERHVVAPQERMEPADEVVGVGVGRRCPTPARSGSRSRRRGHRPATARPRPQPGTCVSHLDRRHRRDCREVRSGHRPTRSELEERRGMSARREAGLRSAPLATAPRTATAGEGARGGTPESPRRGF